MEDDVTFADNATRTASRQWRLVRALNERQRLFSKIHVQCLASLGLQPGRNVPVVTPRPHMRQAYALMIHRSEASRALLLLASRAPRSRRVERKSP